MEPTAEKEDANKAPWDLVPWDAIDEVVGVLKHGAEKYGTRNWEKGLSYNRLFSAAMRHLLAWWRGEDDDKETGSSHLAHACCCLLFLLAYDVRGQKNLDNRPDISPRS